MRIAPPAVNHRSVAASCILITWTMEVFTSLKVYYVWGGRRGHLTWFHKIRFMFMFMTGIYMCYLLTVVILSS